MDYDQIAETTFDLGHILPHLNKGVNANAFL